MHLFPILVVQTVLDALTRCRVAASSHANLALSGLTPRSVMPTLRLAYGRPTICHFSDVHNCRAVGGAPRPELSYLRHPKYLRQLGRPSQRIPLS